MAAAPPGYVVRFQSSGYIFCTREAGWFLPRVWGTVMVRLGASPRVDIAMGELGRQSADDPVVAIRFAQQGTLQADRFSGELRGRDGTLRATAEFSDQALTVRNARGVSQLSLRPHPGPATDIAERQESVASPVVFAGGGRCWALDARSGDGRRQLIGGGVRQV
jgi:hypothetical protein